MVYIFIQAALIWQFNVPAYSGCVILPHGLVIAYEGYVRPAFFRRSRIVVKTSDGQVLTRGDSARFVFSETTAYWHDNNWHYSGNSAPENYKVVKVAYRQDVGFIKQPENPNLYSELVENAGDLLEYDRDDIIAPGTSSRLRALVKKDEYRLSDCDLPLFAALF